MAEHRVTISEDVSATDPISDLPPLYETEPEPETNLAPFDHLNHDGDLFTVTYTKALSYRDIYPKTDRWTVHLPHQCDDWEIVEAETREQAMVQLTRFIVLAGDALARLVRMEVDDE